MTVRRSAVLPLWQRVYRASVWHPLNTDPTDDNRSGPRFWFPMYDLIAFYLGLTALQMGSPILNRLFSPPLVELGGVALMAAAAACFIGVVFPKFGVVELAGKLSIVFMLGGYAGTIAFLSKEPNNRFVVVVLVMAIWLLGPRVTKLFIQISRIREAKKKA
jgi:hypothetical protein